MYLPTLSLLTLTLLSHPIFALPTPTNSAQQASAPSCGGPINSEAYCAGTNYTASETANYLCGDSRLGPTRLPGHRQPKGVRPPNETRAEDEVLAAELFGYDRFGGLCPGAFLERWFNESIGWWNYPPQNGFAIADQGGAAIDGNLTLAVGTKLDRFGSEGGTFVSPAGAPYSQRALPPSNLVGSDQNYPYGYHVYSVVKSLEVLAGPIAPWFGQPGAGVQYMLYDKVANLVSQGYLKREVVSV